MKHHKRPFAARRLFTAIALASGALLAGTAFAHQVWLQQDAKEAKLYFGEFGENLREASPGLLDKFVLPTAQKISAKGSESIAVTKTPDGFAVATRAGSGESLIAEDAGYPVSERKTGENVIRSVYQPAARLVTDLKKHEPKLTLDLVPTGQSGKDGIEFQAFYKGQPLPKAKVAVVTASNWAQEHHTDDLGKFRVQLPWKGTYVLELSHNDATGGERGPEKYNRASYVTSLTVSQSQGIAALPASPAATPNK